MLCGRCQQELVERIEGGQYVASCDCARGVSTCNARTARRAWRRAVIRAANGIEPSTFTPTARTPDHDLSSPDLASDATAEDRAQHIADKIKECADSLGREPCDLTWEDFRAYGGVAWGANRFGIARKDITRLGGFNAIRDTYFPPSATEQRETRRLVMDHARLNRQLGTTAIRDDLHLQQIEEWAAKVFASRPAPAVAPTILKHALGDEIERELILPIADPHFGANIKGVETGGPDYGPIEEARSFAQCASRLLDWKPEHRKKTGLTIPWLGDLIEGDIHDPRGLAPLSEQICRMIHVGVRFIERLAPEFSHITNRCVSGNHDRDVNRHPSPAMGAKWDSHATVIYYAMMCATRHLDNVSWDIPRSAFCTWQTFDKWYYATHGDTDLHTGNPGQSINVKQLEAEANKHNSTLALDKRVSVFMAGHVHSHAYVQLNCGADIIISGPMTPVNSYARSIGIYHGRSSQLMLEAVPGHPAGDRCPIDLTEEVYRDESLDRLIQPWKES